MSSRPTGELRFLQSRYHAVGSSLSRRKTEVEDYHIQVFGRHAIDTDTQSENEKHRQSSSPLRLANTLVACRSRPAWRIDGHLQVDNKVSAYVGHIRRLG